MVNVCPGHGWPRALLPSELVLFWIPHCMYDIGHPCSCQCISTHPQIKPLMQGHMRVADFITGDKGEVYLAAITHLESNICHPELTTPFVLTMTPVVKHVTWPSFGLLSICLFLFPFFLGRWEEAIKRNLESLASPYSYRFSSRLALTLLLGAHLEPVLTSH